MSRDLLRRPSLELVPDYVAARRKGGSPDNLRREAAQEQQVSASMRAKIGAAVLPESPFNAADSAD